MNTGAEGKHHIDPEIAIKHSQRQAEKVGNRKYKVGSVESY